MQGQVRLWFLPIAIFKWTMFTTNFVRKNWDGSSYSYEVQLIGRWYSPSYWIRAIIVVIACGFRIREALLILQTETNIFSSPKKSLTGYIPLKIWKPIRYLYFFTTLYIL